MGLLQFWFEGVELVIDLEMFLFELMGQLVDIWLFWMLIVVLLEFELLFSRSGDFFIIDYVFVFCVDVLMGIDCLQGVLCVVFEVFLVFEELLFEKRLWWWFLDDEFVGVLCWRMELFEEIERCCWSFGDVFVFFLQVWWMLDWSVVFLIVGQCLKMMCFECSSCEVIKMQLMVKVVVVR